MDPGLSCHFVFLQKMEVGQAFRDQLFGECKGSACRLALPHPMMETSPYVRIMCCCWPYGFLVRVSRKV